MKTSVLVWAMLVCFAVTPVSAQESDAMMDSLMVDDDMLFDIQDVVLDFILDETDAQGFVNIDGRELSFLDFHQNFSQDKGGYVICAEFIDLNSEEQVDVDFSVMKKGEELAISGMKIHKVGPLSEETKKMMMESMDDIQDDMKGSGSESKGSY